jgi:ADP-ribose pyrophosphatase YjhB (NUDIX family)
MQAIAQNGLTFAKDPYDQERYEALRRLAAEVLAAGSTLEAEPVLELFAAEKGYATPKVDVRGVVFRDDRLLLVKERSDGGWTLPGGWADVSASPAENVTREIQEETGFLTRAVKLLALYDREKHPHRPASLHHIYKVFVRCEIIGGEAAASLETEAVGFFGEWEIPELSLARVVPAQIARCFVHLRAPGLPADFD